MSIEIQIVEYMIERDEARVKDLVDETGASKQMVHLVLNKLMEQGLVQKIGRTPKVIYKWVLTENKINEPQTNYNSSFQPSKSENDFLNKNFILVDAIGNLLERWNAFLYWCNQRNLPPEKTLKEFIATKKKYESYYDKYGIINGTQKLMTTKGYSSFGLNELYYLDFYAIERFGKTKLGTILHYAKQAQNKFLMRMMMKEINERIQKFVKTHKADAIGFVPPTIKREVQIMKYMQTHLQINLPIIEIKKITGLIPVPQKSLSKLDERIRNADNSFMITEKKSYNHIVLIDDAVGSGATMNQIALKIKDKKIAKKITGLAVVGSFKGFDVITDV